MASSGTFAVKLHVADLWQSDASGTGTSSELHVFGGRFQRVWIQGKVTRTEGSVFMLSEGDCTVAVKRTSAVVDMWDNVAAGLVVMVIGKFAVKKDSRLVSAHKVRVLENPEQRAAMWAQELHELHTVVYPALHSRLQQQQQQQQQPQQHQHQQAGIEVPTV